MTSLSSPSLPSRGEHRADQPGHSLVNGRVAIVSHDPKWPYLFQQEADRIRHALGDRVRLIEHVGSTAVPDLDAKPCIDVQMAVPEPDDRSTYLPALEEIGYVLFAPSTDWHDHPILKGTRVNVNLHVFCEGSAGLDSMRLFRDFLIADAQARERYAVVKRELGERRWDQIRDYVRAKAGIITELLAQARKWKAERGAE